MILTKEFLELEYLKKEKSVRDIAKQTGFSYPYIQSKIKKFDIERRPQYNNLTGKKFGKLFVKSLHHLDDRQQCWWLCKCKCGKEKLIRSYNLSHGYTKSCGCINVKRHGDITGSYFSAIKYHAKSRNLVFGLKIEDVWELFLKQNKKCAISGVEINFDTKIRGNTTASLDRIDSEKGYVAGNVQWVHKDVNQMKSNRNEIEFLKWIDTIHNYKNSTSI